MIKKPKLTKPKQNQPNLTKTEKTKLKGFDMSKSAAQLLYGSALVVDWFSKASLCDLSYIN